MMNESDRAINLGKVAVLMGGRSAEREISLMSGRDVLKALKSRGVDAHAFDPAHRNLFELSEQGFTRCFIALLGRYGEDGTVQGALELMGIPYTGSGVMASSIAMNKIMTKRVWTAANLPTPRSVSLPRGSHHTLKDLENVIADVGLPLIVKPSCEGSSIGVTRVKEPRQLEKAVQLAAEYDCDTLCEELIEGDEVMCTVLDVGETARTLPLVRVVAPSDRGYDYQNKYFTDDVKYMCPSGLLPSEEKQIQDIVLRAYRVLGCRGCCRADVMIRASDRQPFLLEMNTLPVVIERDFVIIAEVAGIGFEELCMQLLECASLDYNYKKYKTVDSV